MAWNEPGGSQQNPWGKRPKRSSDDAFRNFQRKLESILKGAGSGPSGGGDDGADSGDGKSQLVVFVGVLLAFVAYQSAFTIDQAERGVIQRFGQFQSLREPGLGFMVWPIDRLTKVNTQAVSSVNYTAKVLTQDINLVDMSLAVQYQTRDPVKYLFRVRDPVQTLRDVGESAIREVVGRNTLDSIFVSNREQVTTSTRDLIQRTLDQYETGIFITSVNLTDIQVPTDVQESQRDANKALADKERLVKEAEAYASGILPVAEGAASRQLQEAEGYRAQTLAIAEGEAQRFTQLVQAYERSPRVTRERLYIETVESVMNRSQKVVVDTKGNNQMLYLPLDRMMERGANRNNENEPMPRVTVEAEPPVNTDPRSRVER
ncbi:MAG: FtsH protease activity modulator HflK [Steroidobacteraceae bacterium]|jgi:membrane protease subunit HflK|nr:FtsH protease activity modulator HflK [Gammaproteobacteria bacterium]